MMASQKLNNDAPCSWRLLPPRQPSLDVKHVRHLSHAPLEIKTISRLWLYFHNTLNPPLTPGTSRSRKREKPPVE